MAFLLNPASNDLKQSKLNSAILIGATTQTSSRIWVRVFQEGSWSLVLTEQPIQEHLGDLHDEEIVSFLVNKGVKSAFLKTHYFDQKTNLTHVFDATGLKSDTRYYCAVISNETGRLAVGRRVEIGGGALCFFQTMPVSPAELVFGFYSCHDPMSANGDIGAWPNFYEKLIDTQAHFVIGGGDQIYVDTNKKINFLDIWEWLKSNKVELIKQNTDVNGNINWPAISLYLLNIYRWYYRVYWHFPAVREVYERFPQYMMWDDHEIMDGWGSLTTAERLHKISGFFDCTDNVKNQGLVDCMWRAAKQAYYEYEHSHNPDTGINLEVLTQTPDISDDLLVWDYAFQQGDSAFYVLDMRGHHDVQKEENEKVKSKKDPNKILGLKQLKRFTAWLSSKEVKNAKTVFIVSPVPVIHWKESIVNNTDYFGNKDDCMDEWGHVSNQQERDKLLEAIFAIATGKKVVLLSGDVHCAAVFKMRHKDYPLAKVFQVTSSGISRQPSPEILSLAIASGGKIAGGKNVYYEKLYGMAGAKNFALVHVKKDGEPELVVNFYWPAGQDYEVTRKRVILD